MGKSKEVDVMRAVANDLLSAVGKTSTVIPPESSFSAVEMAGSMEQVLALASRALEQAEVPSESHVAAVEMAGALALYFNAKAKELEAKGVSDKPIKVSKLLDRMFSGVK